MNVPTHTEPAEGVVTAIGTATNKYLANNPVVTVLVADGREIAVLYPADRRLPTQGETLKLLHGANRFFGDLYTLAP